MRKNYIKEIIETFLGNEMPQEVQQAFGDWLRDPEARTEKEQTLETYWERLEAAERPGRDRKLARLHEAIRREESFRRRSLWRKVAAAAAVVLLAVGVNYFAAQGYLRSRVQTNIVTSAHDKGEYVLPDGTRIWLNAGSVLRYYGDLSGRKRVVELTGEAFFKVRHDEKRPFILKADDMNIEVLGTEFDFINYAEFSTTEVILCSGSVRAFGGRLPRPVILKPGERLAYSKKDGRISLSQVTALNYSQWMNGELSFDNAPAQRHHRQSPALVRRRDRLSGRVGAPGQDVVRSDPQREHRRDTQSHVAGRGHQLCAREPPCDDYSQRK